MTSNNKSEWPTSVSRRQILAATGLAGATALAGCGGDGGDGDGDGGGDGDGDGGGVLRMPMFQGVSNLEPANYITAANVVVGRLLNDGLLKLDINYNPQPAIAKSLPETPDETTYVFELRENVKSHDGTSINAEDVKASYEFTANPDKSPRAGQYSAVDSVEIIDDYTIQFNLSNPLATFVPLMAAAKLRVNVVTAESREGLESDGSQTKYSSDPKGIGTGPFKLVEWTGGEKLVLESFDDYYLDDVPKIDRVELPIMEEASVRLTSFQGRDLDILTKPPRKDIRSLKDQGDFEFEEVPSLRVQTLWFNTSKPPFDDWRVRRAMVHAYDKESIISKVYNGFAVPAVGYGLPDSDWWVEEAAQYTGHDLDKAQSFLDEAGMSDGFEFDIFTMPGRWSQIAEILQESLSELNVTANITENQYPAIYDHFRNNEAGMTIQNIAISIDPTFVFKRQAHPEGDFNLSTHYDDPELTEMIDSYMRETDREARIEKFKEAQLYAAERAVMSYNVWNVAVNFWHPYVEGYNTHPASWYVLDDVTVNK